MTVDSSNSVVKALGVQYGGPFYPAVTVLLEYLNPATCNSIVVNINFKPQKV